MIEKASLPLKDADESKQGKEGYKSGGDGSCDVENRD